MLHRPPEPSRRRVAPVALLLLLSSVLLVLASCASNGPDDDDATPDDDDAAPDDDDSTAEPPPPLTLEEVVLDGDFSDATGFVFLPGPDRELFVWEKNGRIGHLELTDTLGAVLVREFSLDGVHHPSDCGLIDLALAPDFEQSGRLAIGYCVSGALTHIEELIFDPTGPELFTGSREVLLAVEVPGVERNQHNVGSLGFEEDGTIWALLGEKRESEQAQDRHNELGSLVRFVPGPSGPQPAPGNPWADGVDGSPLVYTYGLRSPWTGLRDSLGRFWVGDVGTTAYEEINLVTAPGQNFAWPIAEGACLSSDCEDTVDPTLSWTIAQDHPYIVEDPEVVPAAGRVVWVGCEYLPPAELDRYGGQLTGRVLFGDYNTGFVRAAKVDADGELLEDRHLVNLPSATSWHPGADGYIYALTLGDGSNGPPALGQGAVSRLWRLVLEG